MDTELRAAIVEAFATARSDVAVLDSLEIRQETIAGCLDFAHEAVPSPGLIHPSEVV